ncbi:MAG: hypothetical protein IJU40_03290 [Desulfovibrionaceae bacterium]|nr:hypothetical protein [Desulfovibrionaceae bacterium]
MKWVISFIIGLMLISSGSLQAASPKNDIITATLYGSKEDLSKILQGSDKNFQWKVFRENKIDARNVALFYALSCNKLNHVNLLFKSGANWQDPNLSDMPSMEEECKKKLDAEYVRKSIFEIQKEWDEGDIDGDCDRGENIYEITSSPQALNHILKHDKNLCNYKTKCGKHIKDVLINKQNDTAFLKVYSDNCK